MSAPAYTPAPSGACLASRPVEETVGYLGYVAWQRGDNATLYRIVSALPSPWSAFFPVGTTLAAVTDRAHFVQLDGEPFTPMSSDLWASFFAWHRSLPASRAARADAERLVSNALAQLGIGLSAPVGAE